MAKGFDLSHWNGKQDIRDLKDKYGYEFAILKLGTYTSTRFVPDAMFQTYADECEKTDTPYGAYVYLNGTVFHKNYLPFYYYADTVHALWGRKLDYPLYLDVEENDKSVNIVKRTELIISIMNTWEMLGFYAGIYASEKSGFNTIFKSESVTDYTWWVANWSKYPKIKFGMWQCASGISTASMLDENITTTNFPKAMRDKKLNGYW